MSLALDLKLAEALDKRLGELLDEAKNALLVPKEFDKYHQSLGMIEGWRQVKDFVLPEIITKLQEN